MVCKEDVISWFKEAASYRRIDVMCSLLNMCIPFELRYLGTCIEEQGKHDYQELRGAALTANSHEKLVRDFTPYKGLLDRCTRHRLTIYVSLLQSRNYNCANWMYNTLLRTECVDTYLANNNFNNDVNLHTELLLLFTLALNHPAFTFEQKRYFGDVVSRLSEPELQVPPIHSAPPCPPGLGYITPQLPVHHLPPMSVPPVPAAPSSLPPLPPHTTPLIPPPTVTPLTEPPIPLPPPGLPLPLQSTCEYPPQGLWSRNPFSINTSYPPPPTDLTAFPPPISPLISRQSSPTASRAVSPSRVVFRGVIAGLKERVGGKESGAFDGKGGSIEEAHSEEKQMSHQWMETMAAGNKLANGIIGNVGMPLNTTKCPTMYLSSDLQSLSLDGDAPHRCTSSSGSSNSSECHTPPDTPTELVTPPHGPGRGTDPSKIRNGGNGNPPPGLPSVTDQIGGTNPALYTSTCTVPYSTHYPIPGLPSSAFHNRSFLYTQAYRPQFAAYQQNGEIPYIYPSYVPMMYSSALPPPKITCYNCGLMEHTGSECKESTIEEITQKKGYQLDYTTPPPDAPPSSDK